MTIAEVISFLTPSFEDKYVIYSRPHGGGGGGYKISAAAYHWDLCDLLRPVVRPFTGGWVRSEAACFQRRTKAEYIKMFQLNGGDVAFDLIGFRDVAEGLLCEAAALEAGSTWRFLDYYRRNKEWGGDGLGFLNIALDEYGMNFIPGLFPKTFPVPSPNE